MNININNKDVEMQFHFATELLYEQIQEKTFTGQTTTDWIIYFFCTVISCTEDGFIAYPDFLKWLDEHPTEFYSFIEWYSDYVTKVAELRQATKKEVPTEAKKKSKVKKLK